MGRKHSGRTPRWLRHRSLVAAEALLLAGVAKYELSIHVMVLEHVPHWGKVVFIMAMTIGIFGALFLGLDRLLARSVGKTHDVVQALPLPLPLIAIHLAALIGIFYLYAWIYALPVWPMAGTP